jgi:hypothetical protein
MVCSRVILPFYILRYVEERLVVKYELVYRKLLGGTEEDNSRYLVFVNVFDPEAPRILIRLQYYVYQII